MMSEDSCGRICCRVMYSCNWKHPSERKRKDSEDHIDTSSDEDDSEDDEHMMEKENWSGCSSISSSSEEDSDTE